MQVHLVAGCTYITGYCSKVLLFWPQARVQLGRPYDSMFRSELGPVNLSFGIPQLSVSNLEVCACDHTAMFGLAAVMYNYILMHILLVVHS